MVRQIWVSLSAITLAACAGMGGGDQQSASKRAKVPETVVVRTESSNLIPAGTEIAIHVTEAISTKRPSADKMYSAQFAQEIIRRDTGKVMIPKGAPVELVVLDKSQGGAFESAELELGIASVTVNGKKLDVTSDRYEQKGRDALGANPRTGAFVGTGAVLGTMIGAVAGGTEGAIIGGLLGAGAGATTAVATRGTEVRVPEGAILTFRLEEPLRLKPEQRRQRREKPREEMPPVS